MQQLALLCLRPLQLLVQWLLVPQHLEMMVMSLVSLMQIIKQAAALLLRYPALLGLTPLMRATQQLLELMH
jgi:hypothetical protein